MKAIHAFLLVLIGLTGSLQAKDIWQFDEEARAAATRLDKALEQYLIFNETRRMEKQSSMPPVTPPPLADDATFLRRSCVDIAGRLPTAEELKVFMADTTADKHSRLIIRLFYEPAAAERRFQRLADPLRVKDQVFGVSQETYLEWLRQAFREDRPFSKILSQLLTAEGSLKDNPAAGFLLRDFGCAQATAVESTRAFLGEDIHCAGCHDHPFADTTQRQYYEFAAAFAVTRSDTEPPKPRTKPKTLIPGATPVGKKKVTSFTGPPAVWRTLITLNPTEAVTAFSRLRLAHVPGGMTLPPRYLYRDGKSGDPVDPKVLPLDPLPLPLLQRRPQTLTGTLSDEHARSQLAQWFTDGNHERLSKTASLRVWSWMFGTPAVPLSRAKQWREGSTLHLTPQEALQRQSCGMPPSLSLELGDRRHWLNEDAGGWVTALHAEFERCGYRLGRFQFILAHTQAYQRQAMQAPGADGFGLFQFLPAPLVRRMPADVLWDTLVSYLPKDQRNGDREPVALLPQVLPENHHLRILGRGSREWADEDVPSISHRLAQMMIADPLIQKATSKDSHLISEAVAETSPAAQVDRLFLDILSRKPRESERNAALASDWDAPGTALPDIAWALLNTREFLFHH